jgi:endogenous inhibitor of DNA gyrase (YacG/DUF329 family)
MDPPAKPKKSPPKCPKCGKGTSFNVGTRGYWVLTYTMTRGKTTATATPERVEVQYVECSSCGQEVTRESLIDRITDDFQVSIGL